MTREILTRMFLEEDLTSAKIGEILGKAQNTVAKKLSEFKISKKNSDGTFKKGFKKKDRKGKNTERIVQHLDGEIIKIWKSQKLILKNVTPKLHNRTLYNALNNFGQLTTRGFNWDYEKVFARKYTEQYNIKMNIKPVKVIVDNNPTGYMTRREKVSYWTIELNKVWIELGYRD